MTAPATASGDRTQPERTRLAWRRTTLTPLVLVAITTAHGLVAARPAGLVAGPLMLLGWLALVAVARRRMAALRAGSTAPVVRTPAAVGLLAANFAALGLLLLR